MMCEFYKYTGKKSFLSAAEAPLQTLVKYQNENGSWPAYLGNPEKRQISGFTDHAMMAIADFYSTTDDRRCLEPLQRSFKYFSSAAGIAESLDVSPLGLYGLAVLGEKTGEGRYAEAAVEGLKKIRTNQNTSSDPYGRGDTWAVWGVNNPEGAKGSGRPAQFLEQTRPLSVGFILSYGQPAWSMVSSKAQQAKG
jgi:rhamnogalacturonyl hydrolase YesR